MLLRQLYYRKSHQVSGTLVLSRLDRFFLLLSLMLTLTLPSSYAQIDTSFWFAAPDLTSGHQQSPIRFCISSLDDSITVFFEQPANPNYVPVTISLPPNSFYIYDVSSIIGMVENQPINTVLNYGFHIHSTGNASVYYEVVGNDSEIYALKGRNALGCHFVVGMQQLHPNRYSYTPMPYSSIEIVATEDSTAVTITPSHNLRNGSNAGVPFTVYLNRGQTYVVQSASVDANQHLGNTVIQSNKPIAVNSSDDSVAENTGYDLVGDQILPVIYAGNLYIPIWNGHAYETVFLFPTDNTGSTSVYVNNDTIPAATLSFGDFYAYPLASQAPVIVSDRPVVAFQLTGTASELGGTVLPQLECTGSRKVAYSRPNTSTNVTITILAKTEHVGNFLFNNDSTLLTSADFTPVPADTTWSYCKKDVSSLVPVNSLMIIQNSAGNFHLGVVDGSSGSCSYGFFSDYQKYAQVELSASSPYCHDDTIFFQVSASGLVNLTMTGPNGFVRTAPPFIIPNANVSHSGRYYLSGQDTTGCAGTVVDSIDVLVGTPQSCIARNDFVETTRNLPVMVASLLNDDLTCDFPSIQILDAPLHGATTVMDSTVLYSPDMGFYGQDSLSYVVSCCSARDTAWVYFTVRNQIIETNFTVTACESYEWNGITYSSTGEYTQTFQSFAGFDSVVTMHLVILPPMTFDYSASSCGSFLWQDSLYTASGDYVTTMPMASGCDIIMTLHLEILNPVVDSFSVSACNSYYWNGYLYSTTGEYVQQFYAANGCDSIVTMHLTILPPKSSEFNVTACDSYVWSGQTYTTSGEYHRSFTTSDGCDSSVVMHLVVYPSVSTEFNATNCESYLWNDSTYIQSGDYVRHFQTQHGCDSAVTMHLTLYQPTVSEFTVSDCGSYVWDDSTFLQTGDYVRQYQTTHGCDSIVTMHLSIFEPENTEFDTATCDIYFWNGYGYSDPGDYEQHFQTSHGCDSLVTMHLTTYPHYNLQVYDNVCEGQDFETDGFFVSASELAGHSDFVLTQNLTSSLGCDSMVTLYLTVLDTAISLLSSSPTLCGDLGVDLSVTPDFDTYLWDTGDMTPSITVMEPGSYAVTATRGECVSRSAITIQPCDLDIFMPNSITPSVADGLNDYFELPAIYQNQMYNFSIRIYDRWGSVVYSSRDKAFRWNGEVNGKIHANVMYSYIIQYQDRAGASFLLKGSLLVL